MMNEILRSSRVLLLLGACVASLGAAPVRPPDDTYYGTCTGTYVQATGELRCSTTACSPGCAKMAVETPVGAGRICVCDYTGPQPFCCTIALTEIGAYTAYGTCSTPSCPAGNLCSTFPGSAPGTTQARCLTL